MHIPSEFVTHIDFGTFWHQVLGEAPSESNTTDETLQRVKSALLDAGVPVRTVRGYFFALCYLPHNEDATERILFSLDELSDLEEMAAR